MVCCFYLWWFSWHVEQWLTKVQDLTSLEKNCNCVYAQTIYTRPYFPEHSKNEKQVDCFLKVGKKLNNIKSSTRSLILKLLFAFSRKNAFGLLITVSSNLTFQTFSPLSFDSDPDCFGLHWTLPRSIRVSLLMLFYFTWVAWPVWIQDKAEGSHECCLAQQQDSVKMHVVQKWFPGQLGWSTRSAELLQRCFTLYSLPLVCFYKIKESRRWCLIAFPFFLLVLRVAIVDVAIVHTFLNFKIHPLSWLYEMGLQMNGVWFFTEFYCLVDTL